MSWAGPARRSASRHCAREVRVVSRLSAACCELLLKGDDLWVRKTVRVRKVVAGARNPLNLEFAWAAV